MQKKLTEIEKLTKLDELITRLNSKLNSLTSYESMFGEVFRRLITLNSDIKEMKSDLDFVKANIISSEKL